MKFQMKNESRSRSKFLIQVQAGYKNTWNTESLTNQSKMAAYIEPGRNIQPWQKNNKDLHVKGCECSRPTFSVAFCDSSGKDAETEQKLAFR